MSMASKRAGVRASGVVAVFAMLIAAVMVMVPLSIGKSATLGPALAFGGASEPIAPPPPCSQLPVPLNSSGTYAVLANSTVTNTGPTSLTGDLGLSPGTSVTGFPPGTFTGTENINNASSAGAQGNLTQAYNNASGRTNCSVSVAGNLGGQTLTPGLYTSTSTLAVSSGDLTLSGQGDAGAVFIFQVASTLTTTSGRFVNLTNGTQAANVFWQVGSSATLGTNSTFQGTIMAYASVTLATGATLNGRALARTGAVTLASSTVVVPAAQPTYAVTFSESGLPSGTSWSVTLNGGTVSSITSTVVFSEVDGTYAYTIGSVPGYSTSPSTGSVNVSGSAVTHPVAFTVVSATTYDVTFTESGLPSGTSWSATLNGTPMSSTTSTVVFIEVNGTFSYTIGSVAGYTASPASGSVTVVGAAVNRAIAFAATAASTYSVTFTESGLPSGTSWSVTLNGTTTSSTTTTVVFTEVNGTYDYTIGAVTGYLATPASGSVPVSGAPAAPAIAFTAVVAATYSVTFTETGLPAGTNWSVTLSGVAKSSVTTTIVFTKVNGTYAFTVSVISSYNATPPSGSVHVAGNAATQAITFASSSGPGGTDNTTPLTSEWWFWAAILLLIVAIVIGIALALMRRPKTGVGASEPPA
jgi:hypothetical protein